MFDARLAPLPDSPHVFRTSWPVRAGDVDRNTSLRRDGVARYLQDAGFDHLDHVEARGEHPIWVVRRTVIDIIEPITFPDTVTVERWCSGISSRWCTMRVRLSTPTGGLIETEGFWINLSPTSGMPTRITDGFEKMLGSTAETQRLRWRSWITETPLERDTRAAFPIRAVDIDLLGHVNNSIYLQAVEEVLHHRPELQSVPTRTAIEYLAPIPPDAEVELAIRQDEKAFITWFTVNGKTSAQAKVAPLD
ncbi:hypothetical protein HT102_15160 [Hoyosella sp. G463]|uniref:Acyl-ACP thioesterase n=1 Tax=Lolliginicoccus lacisalsi TaxID=2742202 RepID=A0A927JF66_9ACTN|nr:acyl-ACP thioesterase domain-containing protein [Lolliginicoccus lacisalsi]MBD8507827.1 hypothetical protein [Lolliginicoccus lacisalsi]